MMTRFLPSRSLATLAVLLSLMAAARADSPIVLRDVTRETGIAFQHSDGSGGQRYIMETVASGMASFDYDGDGRIDLYFVTGTPLKGTKAEVLPKNRLYRNLGNFKFADVTDQAGVGESGYGLGVCVGDYDDDGRPDIYLSNFGPNVLYHNNGDGTFTNVAKSSGTLADDATKVGAGACFLDADGDGSLDLFVSNYLRFSYDKHLTNVWRGVTIYVGPERYPPMASILYRNRGDGAFQDVSKESGIAAHEGPGMGIICADYDNDGDTDILVGNDGGPGNFLFRNDGTGKFEEVGINSGIALSGSGLAHGSMGIDCGDYDNDGWLDFFVTAYQRQPASLFRNLGDGTFEDVTNATGAGQGSTSRVKWGCGFVDFDNDGRRDLFVVCGHLLDNAELVDDSTTYLQAPVLLHNDGNGKFVNISGASGDGLQKASVGRGAVFEDLDGDGRVDVVILNSRRPPTVLRNESKNDNHWLQVRLRGAKTNRDGVGAHVRVVAGDLAQIDEVHSGRSYQSHFGSQLHFGLGKRDKVDRIEVRWIGGGVDVFEDVGVDQVVTLTERRGLAPGDATAANQ